MADSDKDFMTFATADDLAEWFIKNHKRQSELWIRIFKKASGTPTVSWKECVIESLRFGWIDGQKKSLDDLSYLQRITPRRAKSNWSAVNCSHVNKLIEEGRMMPAGLVHVEAAKADGRWENAYSGSADMVIAQDFLDALDGLPAAKAFYETLDRRNLFTIYHRLHSAKRPETRARRMSVILEQLARGERFH